ncbi:MAG: GNAT family N-acetyltransferase [Alphaproteobacteria bacterium]|nr:GNAT family N-acetyltransferase [Alphaproteobacteria bacterium]
MALAHALSVHTQEPTGNFTPEAMRAAVFDDPRVRMLVAEVGGKVVGYAMFHDSYDTANAARGLYLNDIIVDERVRGDGVARALMAGVVREAKRQGDVFVWWTAKPTNARALAFYMKLGAINVPAVTHAIFGPAFDALAEETDEAS